MVQLPLVSISGINLDLGILVLVLAFGQMVSLKRVLAGRQRQAAEPEEARGKVEMGDGGNEKWDIQAPALFSRPPATPHPPDLVIPSRESTSSGAAPEVCSSFGQMTALSFAVSPL